LGTQPVDLNPDTFRTGEIKNERLLSPSAFVGATAILILIVRVLPCKEYPQVKRKLSNFNIIFTQMKQQTNNPQQLKKCQLKHFIV
jgi:hypothetical protein